MKGFGPLHFMGADCCLLRVDPKNACCPQLNALHSRAPFDLPISQYKISKIKLSISMINVTPAIEITNASLASS